jgi:hypothetical protein
MIRTESYRDVDSVIKKYGNCHREVQRQSVERGKHRRRASRSITH